MSVAVPMRALTIRQPWGFSVAEGFKPIENRTRRTNHRGPILIHTSKMQEKSVSIVRWSRDAAIRMDQLGGQGNYWDAVEMVPSRFFTPPATLALRGIIATARIAGCHRAGDDCGPACAVWGEPEAWHWEIADARPLKTAIGVNGALGLWTPAEAVQQAVRDQQATVLRTAADLLDDGAPVELNLARDFPGDEAAAVIDGAVANLMRTSAFALENGAECLDTPRLLTEAYRLTISAERTTA